MAQENLAPPDLAAIEEARVSLGDLINETPVHHWRAAAVSDALGADSAVFLKLELFQRTGTFKARGALLSALALDDAARARGVTAVSAGNHAIAVAFAAHSVGTSAKVVMMEGADPFRVDRCAVMARSLCRCRTCTLPSRPCGPSRPTKDAP